MTAGERGHEEQVRIFLRPIGSALPLGFFSFGIGMLLLGCFAIGWIPAGEQKDVGMLLMAFVFPLELVATIVAFLARDTLGATTLGLFTTSWLALGWIDVVSQPGSTSDTLGIYYETGGDVAWNHVAGGFGIALALLAMYGGTALSLEDARHLEVLPLFRRGGAQQAFHGYQAQLERLEAEPGVRQQL